MRGSDFAFLYVTKAALFGLVNGFIEKTNRNWEKNMELLFGIAIIFVCIINYDIC